MKCIRVPIISDIVVIVTAIILKIIGAQFHGFEMITLPANHINPVISVHIIIDIQKKNIPAPAFLFIRFSPQTCLINPL